MVLKVVPTALLGTAASTDHILLVFALAMLVAMLQSMPMYFSVVVISVLAVGWRTASQSEARRTSPFDSCSPPPDMPTVHSLEQEHTSSSTEGHVDDDMCPGLETLRVRDECSSTGRGIAINSATPVPFENDFFQGHVYFLVKTTPPNTTWEGLFAGRKRNFWIQVQGKFKRRPRGSVFMGGELPHSVSVGFLARSLARVVAGIMRRFLGTTHVGFGDDVERPHCVFPLYQTVDEMVITPDGATPPPLGQAHFGETPVAQQRRRQTPLGTETFHTNATYSFQFHTMYVDMAKWTIVNVPGMQDVHLRTFFKQVPLHLTCYDVQPTPRHDHAAKQYMFCFSVHWTPPSSASSTPCSASIPSPTAQLRMPRPTSIGSPSIAPTSPPTPRAPLCIPYWLERLDHSKTRVVVYLARDLPTAVVSAESPRLHELPAKVLRSRFSPLSKIHATSKVARYDVIDAHRLLVQASEVDAAVLAPLAKPCAWVSASASSLGVTLNQSYRNPIVGVVLQQQVVRAISDSHLRQEYLVLTPNAMYLFRTYSSVPCASVPLDEIVAVAPWTLPHGDGTPLAYGLHVHTRGGHVYMCLPSAAAEAEWLRAIDHHHARCRDVSNAAPPPRSCGRNPWQGLLPTSRPDVLNTFRLFPVSSSPRTSASMSTQESPSLDTPPSAVGVRDAIAVAAAAVHSANALDNLIKTANSRNEQAWHQLVAAFLEAVALLQWVDLTSLVSYDDRVAFYLNVHSAMAWHVGQFDTNIMATKKPLAPAYRIGSGLVVTLPELQTAALRPRHADTADTSLLSPADFRIRIALHVKTATLPLFDPRRVQFQLNALCTRFLRQTVAADAQRHIVQLPGLCHRFRFDYGPNGTAVECARKVLGFLSEAIAADVHTILLAQDEAPVDMQYVDDVHVVVDGALAFDS